MIKQYYQWRNQRKFAKVGKKVRCSGKDLVVKGHVEVGDYCRIRDHNILRTQGDGKIIIGDRSGLSWYCVIEARERVQIGLFSALTEFCVVRDTNHMIYGTQAHFYMTPFIVKPVIIGDGVFVGSRSYIFPGVTIGDGAVIGAGSVLVEGTTVPPYEIWAGAPARKIAHRTEGVPQETLDEVEKLIAEQGIREDRYGVWKNPMGD